ncbi:MAG: MgtC/SapB family protein [Patescibacteria group bacterium]|nr:MgtC/SapB family protein [Patescibacteria group bacterium]
MELSIQDILTRLILATVLAGLIGIEREVRGKPAGVRTNALIGLGSASMTMCGLFIAAMSPISDPARVASVIVQGIGFLGAGAIIQSSGTIRGLTTAATMWVVAGIGMACGMGFYDIALAVSLIALVLLVIFGPLDAKLMGDENQNGGLVNRLFKKDRK